MGRSSEDDYSAIVRQDPRYPVEAYRFVSEAIRYTAVKLDKDKEDVPPDDARRHISGRELLMGIRELALEQFGHMAKVVLELWGIARTEDFGEIVFNMVEHECLRKTDEDSKKDFEGVYDFAEAFEAGFDLEQDCDFSLDWLPEPGDESQG